MTLVARAWLLLVGAGCAGCHHEAKSGAAPDAAPSSSATASTSPTKDCARPLTEYCVGASCTTYDREAQNLRALIAQYHDSGGCLLIAQLGECGALRVVSQSDGFIGRATYFDANGALVGVKASSDTNEYCDGKAFGATYGNLPACTVKVTQDLCAGAK